MDSATGLCVQGGAPLIGDRGMLPNAISLWIAASLSVLGVVSARAATGQDSGFAVSDIDPKVLPLASSSENRMAGYAGPRRTGGARSERINPPSVLLSGCTGSGSASATHLSTAGRAGSLIQQYSRSLSYLSLTLRCIAPHSGWLGGCAPLPERSGDPTREDGSRAEATYVFTGGQTEPQHAAGPTSRIRPVFL